VLVYALVNPQLQDCLSYVVPFSCLFDCHDLPFFENRLDDNCKRYFDTKVNRWPIKRVFKCCNACVNNHTLNFYLWQLLWVFTFLLA